MLKLYLPDPSIQHGVLDRVVKNVLSAVGQEQTLFRVNLFLNQLGYLHTPTPDSVSRVLAFYKAEMSSLAASSGGGGPPKSLPGSSPQVFALQPPLGGSGGPGGGKGGKGKGAGDSVGRPPPKKECDFFLTPDGCKSGGQCRFKHVALDSASGRCFQCGSERHRREVCDRPAKAKIGDASNGGAVQAKAPGGAVTATPAVKPATPVLETLAQLLAELTRGGAIQSLTAGPSVEQAVELRAQQQEATKQAVARGGAVAAPPAPRATATHSDPASRGITAAVTREDAAAAATRVAAANAQKTAADMFAQVLAGHISQEDLMAALKHVAQGGGPP